MGVSTVFFDVGETLIDETRQWGEWADWLGVTRLTFFALLGAVIERGGSHRDVFELVRPGFDLAAETARRAAAGCPYGFDASDLYDDAAPCLRSLRDAGMRVGLAGNQPESAERALAEMGLAADVIATSQGWGVEKPSPEFFARVAAEAGVPPSEIAYVGDRVDNDVAPARAAGMVAVFIRRGPWGYLHAARPEAALAHVRLQSLAELPAALAAR
ncbi:MAG: HAD family hydrolase [Chloroflexia bacterium]